MLFASYEFLLMFLPITLIGYYMLSKLNEIKWQHLFLIVASLYFYGYFHMNYLFIMITSILVNYMLAILIEKKDQKKLYFIIGIIFNVGLLGFFKYYDFFLETINMSFRTEFKLLHILLPLGISFFTFQQISFIVDIYKENSKVPDLLSYCLFVVFFPQLVAGPIVLYSEMHPQFIDEEKRYFNFDNFSPGFSLFVIGMSKKLIIADTLAVIVDNAYDFSNIGMASAWIVSLAYTMQLYFDFSGYSDMAIGLGKMFNFELPMNFNEPYKSISITDFWRRWHITLGRALSTYIYFPLGGSRGTLNRTCINLIITFLVSGIWHGANWTFILWGILHGTLIVFERITGIYKRNYHTKASIFFRRAITFFCVNLLWVLFRSESIAQAKLFIYSMFNFTNVNIKQIVSLGGTLDVGYAIVVLVIAIILSIGNPKIKNKYIEKTVYSSFSIALLFVVCLICMTRVSPFIYFNF